MLHQYRVTAGLESPFGGVPAAPEGTPRPPRDGTASPGFAAKL
jgi:hypothetical protein